MDFMGVYMDEKDIKIIEILKENSRAGIRDIAKATNIRPSTVHNRIKKLKKEGVIKKFTVVLNDEKVGQGFVVFMLISGTPEKYLDTKFQKNPHIKEICGVTGEYDLLIKAKFKDMREFNDFLINFREKYSKYINKTITMVQTLKLK